mmetsp:Transcript_28591/g.86369  ORF Transcript_28591/g.86369 Transcript_28591/m.86369 type:complete len:284 (-) Transcript_28591:45-896(-)
MSRSKTWAVAAACSAALRKALIGYSPAAQPVLASSSWCRGSLYNVRLTCAGQVLAMSACAASMRASAASAASSQVGTCTAQLILPGHADAMAARRGSRSTLHCVTMVRASSGPRACRCAGAHVEASNSTKSSAWRICLASSAVVGFLPGLGVAMITAWALSPSVRRACSRPRNTSTWPGCLTEASCAVSPTSCGSALPCTTAPSTARPGARHASSRRTPSALGDATPPGAWCPAALLESSSPSGAGACSELPHRTAAPAPPAPPWPSSSGPGSSPSAPPRRPP